MDDRCRNGRLREAGPPGSRVELGSGREQLRTAGGAAVRPVVVAVEVLTREGWLRPGLPEHAVLGRRQLLPPLLFRSVDACVHVIPPRCIRSRIPRPPARCTRNNAGTGPRSPGLLAG